jgi:hypothetical protein
MDTASMGLTSSRVSRTSGHYQPERRPAQTLVPDRADPLLNPLQCGQDRQVAFGPGVAGVGAGECSRAEQGLVPAQRLGGLRV